MVLFIIWFLIICSFCLFSFLILLSSLRVCDSLLPDTGYGASHMTFPMWQDSVLSWRLLRICPNYFGRTWLLVCFLFALLPLFLCSSTGYWFCCFLFFFLLFFCWRTKGRDRVLAPEVVIYYLLRVTLQLKTIGISALKSFKYSLGMCAKLVFSFLQQHYLLSLLRYHWRILVDPSWEKFWFSR